MYFFSKYFLEILNVCLYIFLFCMSRFLLYKLPRLTNGSTPSLRQGSSYTYADNENKEKWIHSDKFIDDHSNAVAYTLQQIFDRRSNKSKVRIHIKNLN